MEGEDCDVSQDGVPAVGSKSPGRGDRTSFSCAHAPPGVETLPVIPGSVGGGGGGGDGGGGRGGGSGNGDGGDAGRGDGDGGSVGGGGRVSGSDSGRRGRSSTLSRRVSAGSSSSSSAGGGGGCCTAAGQATGEEGVKLRVSTPTGDGGASDLSLWITLRGGEAAVDKGEGGDFSISPPLTSSPAPTAVGSDLEDDAVNGMVGRPSSSSSSGVAAAVARGAEGAVGFAAVDAIVANSKALRKNTTLPLTREAIQEATGGGGGCAPISRVTIAARTDEEDVGDAVPLLDRSQVGYMSDRVGREGRKGCANSAESWGPDREEEKTGGWEGFWQALSSTFCGMFDFCRPRPSGCLDDRY